MKQVMLLIGTRKGGFLAFSDVDRRSWELKDPFFKGIEVNHVNFVPSASRAIYMTGRSAWWGPDVRISHDFGDTWVEPPKRLGFAEGRGLSIARIWVIKGDLRSNQEVIYAGVDPAALFGSTDGGGSWEEIRPLTDHPTRGQWMPGAGGLMVHSICVDPKDPQRMFVAISGAGIFRTDDVGRTWSPKNKGVRADFLPQKFPEVGQCSHRLQIHPAKPEILYQQNHCGVYRSDNGGKTGLTFRMGCHRALASPLRCTLTTATPFT